MTFGKLAKQIIGVLLSASLMCGTTVGVYAANHEEVIVEDMDNEEDSNGVEEVDDDAVDTPMLVGDTRIESYETDEGDVVLLQYVNDVLTQKNTIPHNQEDVIIREFFNDSQSGKSTKNCTDSIRPSDYITVTEETEVEEPILTRASAWTTKGTINYCAAIDSGLVYYGMKCSYTKSTTTGTYTIRKYRGTLIDLIAILVSAIDVPTKYVKTFTDAMLVSASITVINGVLKSVLTTTVASENTNFKWKLVDIQDSKHYTYYTNACRHHIIDSKYATNKNYYEGMCPRKWKKQEMAVLFHDSLFGYTSYSVVGWN